MDLLRRWNGLYNCVFAFFWKNFQSNKSRSTKILLCSLIFNLAACSTTKAVTKPGLQGVEEQITVQNPSWREIPDYRMTQQISCGYGPSSNQKSKLEINNRKLVGVIQQREYCEPFMTIEDLFQYIDVGLEKGPEYYEVEYDEKYGYPKYIYFNYASRAQSDIEIQVSDFKVKKKTAAQK